MITTRPDTSWAMVTRLKSSHAITLACGRNGRETHPRVKRRSGKRLRGILQGRRKLIGFKDKGFRFHISQRMLGEGNDGCVYLATELDTNRQVVCKKQRMSVNSINRDKALAEATILRKVNHPNVLGFLHATYATATSTLHTFTELAAGGDLFSYIVRSGATNEWDARLIMRQVSKGVAYLHKMGVVHRDIKPENVFFATYPMVGHRVVLGDFGCSKVSMSGRFRSFVGTRGYQAP